MYGNNAYVAQPFAPFQAPKLSSISRKAIQAFLAEPTYYDATVKAQPEFKAIWWAGCFDALFLRSVTCARVFGSKITNAEQLFDAIIKADLGLFQKLQSRFCINSLWKTLTRTSSWMLPNMTLVFALSCIRQIRPRFANIEAGTSWRKPRKLLWSTWSSLFNL